MSCPVPFKPQGRIDVSSSNPSDFNDQTNSPLISQFLMPDAKSIVNSTLQQEIPVCINPITFLFTINFKDD